MRCKKNNWFIKNREYRDNLNVMYNEVEDIHSNSEAYYFTDHSRKHSDRIAENLVHLFPFLFFGGDGNRELNDVEKFILFSSILLHDIGIRLTNLELLNYIIEKYEMKCSFTEETKLDFIRNNHHTLSKCWIKENVDTDNTKLPILYRGDKILAKYVGYVSESHGINFEDSPEYTETTAYGSERIRMGLLCTLLSLGDALDCDQRRISYDLLKVSNLSIDSRLHWMKHYFVDGIILTSNLIEIYYSFPNLDPDSRDLYQKYFVNKTKYWIEKCFTVRGKFLFPVGAICRVVDNIHFNDDKDRLKDEDFLKVQDNYANEILREGEIQHLHYMQYIVGVIINSKNEILYINPSNSFKTYLMYDGTSDYVECVNEYWKTIFDCNKSEWEPIGKAKIDNAIHNYFLYEFDETVCSLSTTLKFEWLNIESYLNRSNDIFLQKYLIGKLG